MKRFRWLFIALVIALPVGLGGILRERNSWRPQTLLQGRAPVDKVIFSHDGSLLVAAVHEKENQSRLYVWNAHSHVLRFNLVVHYFSRYSSRPEISSCFIRNLWLSPDSNLLAARVTDSIFGRDNSILLWDMKNGWLLHTLDGVENIAFSSDSRFLTGVRERQGKSWHNAQPDIVVYQAGSAKIVRAFNLTPPPKRSFYSPGSGSHGDGSVSYNMSPDGRWVAVDLQKPTAQSDFNRTEYGGALLVDTTGQQRTRILSDNERLELFSSDGRKMLTTNATNYIKWENRQPTVRIRNTQTHQLLSAWKLQPSENAWKFSPDNALVLTYSDNGVQQVQRLREANTGRLKWQEAPVYDTRFLPNHFSPDSTWIGSTGFDASDTRALLWDTKTRQLMRRLKSHTRTVNDMAFSPDSRTLATASNDGSLKLWRLR